MKLILALLAVLSVIQSTAFAEGFGAGYSGGAANVQTFSPGIIAGTLDRNSFGAFGAPHSYGLGGYGSKIGVQGYSCGNSYGGAYSNFGYGGGNGAPFYAGPSLDHFVQADDPSRFDLERESHKLILQQLLQQYDRVYGGFLELEKLDADLKTNIALSQEFRGGMREFAQALAYYKSQQGAGVQVDLETRTQTSGTARALPLEVEGPPLPETHLDLGVGPDAALPLLRRKCFQCHNAANAKGGLNLEAPERLGPERWANRKGEGILDKVLRAEMPPKNAADPRPLTTEEIGVLFAARALWLGAGDSKQE